VRHKAALYGCDPQPAAARGGGQGGGEGGDGAGPPSYKVEPDLVAELYDRWVMPLTKEVKVAYLLRRLDGAPAEPADADGGSAQGAGGASAGCSAAPQL
jgi:hypothetical protein